MGKKANDAQAHGREQQNARAGEAGQGSWAGPFTVANEPAELGDGTKVVQVADAKGSAFCWVLPAHVHGQDWKAATARAQLIVEALNSHGVRHGQTPDEPEGVQFAEHREGEYVVSGTVFSLAQSLKVMGGNMADDGRSGYAVIARRAEQFIRVTAFSVTRFLSQPDIRLRHPTLDFDLSVLGCDVMDSGKVNVRCTQAAEGGGWWVFPLDELVAAGPVGDAVRAAVAHIAVAMVEDAVGQVIAGGGFPGLAALEEAKGKFAGSGGTIGEQLADEPGSETVHHLTTFPEYVLPPGDGVVTKPEPVRDEGDVE